MAASALPVQAPADSILPIETYLKTSFRPDRDYVDGEVLERNVGELPHGTLQLFFGWYFRNHEDEWQFRAVTEQRVQVSSTRYRVPDVCILKLPVADKDIVRTSPAICVEILSKADRMVEMQERVDDYLQMGASAVWIVDPWRRKISVIGQGDLLSFAHETLTLQGTPISIPVVEIFAELDRYGL